MEEITVVDVKPQLVAGIRKKGYYREIAELLPKLYEYATKKGAKFTASPISFATKPQKKPWKQTRQEPHM
jgi:effector-binding domain-containing protein